MEVSNAKPSKILNATTNNFRAVADKLKVGKTAETELSEAATACFSDILSF